MVKRPFWINSIHRSWERRPIVWLSGVRRVGKSTLAGMIESAVYLNCDLPSTVRILEDPESFYNEISKETIVIMDEVHRIEDPSRVLKIAADAYPHLRVLATGSSTLAATRKFRDSLTGRKHTIYLPPVIWKECKDQFKQKDLDKRLLHGGLPEPLLASQKDATYFSEWIDSFYARDIQELFAIRNRTGFLNLLTLILRQSGQQINFSKMAKLSGLSRQTVSAHVEAMKIAHALYLLPPYHGGGRREITQRPKCYGFDTGFITHVKGWATIRKEDRGLLWEHLVLDTLRVFSPASMLFYWRDKSKREIDFIIRENDQKLHTIECKMNPDHFRSDSLHAFRALYPQGDNYVVSPFIPRPFKRQYKNLTVRFTSLDALSFSNKNIYPQ